MKAAFNDNYAVVEDAAGKVLVHATRNSQTGLYEVDDIDMYCGVMFPKSSTVSERVRFFIACMGSPTTATFANAVDKGWIKFPKITSSMVRNHPHSEATAKGHLDRTRAGLDSTNQRNHSQQSSSPHSISISSFECKRTLYADLTGRFPVASARGMEYLMIMKSHNSGYIHAEPMASRSAKDFVEAFEKGIQFFTDHGQRHTLVKMDNETSASLKDSLKRLEMKPEYVVPNNHRQNSAERDIRTFKNHFIATLCTTDNCFPIHEWDLLLPQAEMTLNLMRASREFPDKSSWEHLKGKYDFNRNPIAPAGTRVTILEDSNNRASWAPHGVRGFYIGPAMDHYRAYKVLIENTERIRISDSLTWHPKEEITNENLGRIIRDVINTAKSNKARDEEKKCKRKRYTKKNNTISPPTTPQNQQPATNLNHAQDNNDAANRRTTRKRKPNPRYCNLIGNISKYAGMSKSYRVASRGEDGVLWKKAANEEFDRLIATTNTMEFIHWDALPQNRRVSYYNPQIRIKVKDDGTKEYRVRGTYGGNISDYNGPKAARTADMTSIKILLNATVSEDAKWMTMDIKDFYLGTPMERKEYMRVQIDQIPSESRAKYIKGDMIKNGAVLAEVKKGIYGLAQAGILAQQRLFEHLNRNGYKAISDDHPCLFKHELNDIVFCLVVDDFGVKYKEKEHVEHLIKTLEELYILKVNWVGNSYVGFDIHHDKVNHTITLSMPRYIDDAIKRFRIEDATTVDNPADPSKGNKGDDNEQPANEDDKKKIQQIVGVLLYYARAIDPSLLVRINKIASEISTATTSTLRAAYRVLLYTNSHKDAKCIFRRSDMKLICYSDASYLTERESRSRAGGLMFLGEGDDETKLNGPITCISNIIDVVVSSAAESEYAAAFINAQEAAFIKTTLEALGYKQDPTVIVTDNAFVTSITNSECKQKKSRSMDMRYNWLRDRVNRGQFTIRWCPRERNIADFFTKDLPTNEFMKLRKVIMSNGSLTDTVDRVEYENE